MTRYRAYTGIGSRMTPAAYLTLIIEMGVRLALQGMTLRSGGANGADTAFEHGHRSTMQCTDAPKPEIYVPWLGFNSDSPERVGLPDSTRDANSLSAGAVVIARENHPNWAGLSKGARWMHTRNVAQVLGEDLNTPSEFVLCWTPKGSGTGGTGQAIRIAQAHNIPVYDLGGLALPYVRRKLANDHGVQV